MTPFDRLVGLSVIVVAVAVVWKLVGPVRSGINARDTDEAPTTLVEAPAPRLPGNVEIDTTTLKGSPGAPVAMVIYSDFECPFCSRFATDVLPEIERTYVTSGRVALAFRHFPLERIHKNAFGAAESVECAGRQGAFWPMHDLLFGSPERLAHEDHVDRAAALGIDTERFGTCLAGEAAAIVRKQRDDGRQQGIRSTPTVFIGGLRGGSVEVASVITGARPVAQFIAALDAALIREGQR